jgi:flagellar assembly protein FliH
MRSLSNEFTTVIIPDLSAGRSTDRDSRGHTLGYAAGFSEGIRAAEAQSAILRQQLIEEYAAACTHAEARAVRSETAVNTAIAALNARVTPVLSESHDALAQTAFDLFESIVAAELNDAPTFAKAAVVRALSAVDPSTISHLRMNPQDLSLVSASVRDNPNIAFTGDASLARGDAIATLEHGWLDGRLTTAVGRARAELLSTASTPAGHNDSA